MIILAGSPTPTIIMPKVRDNQAMGTTSGSYQSDDDDVEGEVGPCEQSTDPLDIKRIRRDSTQNLFVVMATLYASFLFLGINNASSVQPVVSIERTVFYREKAAGMYSPLQYAAAQGLIEIPYVMIQTLLYGVITYFIINFERAAGKFFLYILFMFLTFIHVFHFFWYDGCWSYTNSTFGCHHFISYRFIVEPHIWFSIPKPEGAFADQNLAPLNKEYEGPVHMMGNF